MASAQQTPRVLVYTATAGYRHASIPTAIEVLGQQALTWNVSFEFSEDRSMFTDDTLSGFDGVMFVSNSDEVLDAAGKAALKTFFQSGGVYTGVHGASACLFNDTDYQQAVGALFDYHPQIQSATFQKVNDSHPATANLPDDWTFEEEVYNFRSDPRNAGAVVLLTVDEASYTNDGSSSGDYPSQGSPHPIAWYIESTESAQPLLSNVAKAGRSFYTSLGHLDSTWRNETFIDHVMSGLTWALSGASTRAYDVGLVGNGTASPDGSTTSAGPSSSSSMTGGSTTSSAAGAASSSGAAAKLVSFGSGAALFTAIVCVGAGVRLIL